MPGEIEEHLINVLSWSIRAQENALKHVCDLRDLKVGNGPRVSSAIESIGTAGIIVAEAAHALGKLRTDPPSPTHRETET
jgi:hypothetical protein